MEPEALASIPPAILPFPVSRALASPAEAVSVDGAEMPTMTGHFSTFDTWYEVNSWLEGNFLERVTKRAFNKTMRESRDSMKVLYDHGQDPQIGNKILGPIEDLRADNVGPAYVVPLFDTSYNRDLVPGLEAKVYGSSFRFSVEKDEWDYEPESSEYNPKALPERTITEARVYEFGPVTFPANPSADAGVRSTTDTFYKRSRDPEQFEELVRSAQAARTPKSGAAAPSDEPPSVTPPEPTSTDTPRAVPTTTPQETTTMEYISREEKVSRVAELKDVLARTAVEFPGTLPEDVQTRWDDDDAEIRALEADIAAWDTRQARVAELAGDPKRTEPTFVAPPTIRKQADIYDISALRTETRTREEYDQRVRENALRSIDGSRLPKSANVDALIDFVENRDEAEDGQKGEVAQRILLTGSPLYRRAFAKYLRGEQALWSPEEARAAALAVTGTTTTGGFALPYIFDPTLIHIGVHTVVNPYRAACRVETIANGNNWRAVTVGAVTAVYAAEAAAATEQGPTFGQPTFTVQRAHAFATVSIETLQDRSDISEELSGVFSEAKDTLEENQFTLGVGTTVFPLGMFVDTAFTDFPTATNDVTALADFTAAEAALPLRHRPNAAFFMSRSTQRQLELLDTGGYYFKRPGQSYALESNIPNQSPIGNTGSALLGYPVWEVPSAVSTLTTDGAIIAVFGDPRNYVIVDRIGMNVEVIQNMLNGATPSFPTGQRGIYCYWRNTARPINADGMRSISVQ